MTALVQELKRGGPERCERPCVECPDGKHHFADPMIGFKVENPFHEAARAGVENWYECKHCPAWLECDPDLGGRR